MRTSEQIKTEIAQKFGFFPIFFEPAQQNPQVLENLWQQTLWSYVNNPLPHLFKEKLAAYLSRRREVVAVSAAGGAPPMAPDADALARLKRALDEVDS